MRSRRPHTEELPREEKRRRGDSTGGIEEAPPTKRNTAKFAQQTAFGLRTSPTELIERLCDRKTWRAVNKNDLYVSPSVCPGQSAGTKTVANSVEDNCNYNDVNNGNSAYNLSTDSLTTDSLFKNCYVDTNHVQPTHPVETIGAITAAELRGPWFSAMAGGARFPCAADTFCPRNLISERLAHQLRASVVSEEGRMFGVGDGSINIIGSTTLPVTIGRRTKNVEFKVTPELADFAFFGFAEQARWGFVIETTHQIISFAGESIPYFSNMADALRPAARLAPIVDVDAATKVFLEHSVVIPPSGGGEGFLTFGITRGPRLDGDVVFEPTQLKDRYGMLGPE